MKYLFPLVLIAAALVVMILVLPTIGGGNPLYRFG